MNELTETEKAYLAGFFDGEGCINIGRHTPTGCRTVSHFLQVIIGQCDREFLSKWQHRVGIGKIYEDKGVGKIPKIKRSWHWRIHGAAAEQLLILLLPYLDIKHEEAEIALRFRKTKKLPHPGSRGTPQAVIALREEYKQMLHTAKRKGEKVAGAMHKLEYDETEGLSVSSKEQEQITTSQMHLF